MKRKLTHPLISCLCIAQFDSKLMLKAIISFEEQDYPNKELVISYQHGDENVKEIALKTREFSVNNIVIVSRPSHLSRSEAIKDAASFCHGVYVCLWNEEDCYHPMRIKYQYNNMQINGQYREASIMSNIFVYDTKTKKSYISYSTQCFGTLLCNKLLLQQNTISDNDLKWNLNLIDSLASRKLLHYITDFPALYICIIQCSDEEEDFLKNAELLNQASSDWVNAQVNQQFELI